MFKEEENCSSLCCFLFYYATTPSLAQVTIRFECTNLMPGGSATPKTDLARFYRTFKSVSCTTIICITYICI